MILVVIFFSSTTPALWHLKTHVKVQNYNLYFKNLLQGIISSIKNFFTCCIKLRCTGGPAIQPQSDQQHRGTTANCFQDKHGNTAQKFYLKLRVVLIPALQQPCYWSGL